MELKITCLLKGDRKMKRFNLSYRYGTKQKEGIKMLNVSISHIGMEHFGKNYVWEDKDMY
jgi:hypothetical protein